jgi:hypothetical protein
MHARAFLLELNFLKLGRGLLVVKVSSCKKLKATDSLLYTQAELWLKKS